MKTLEETAVISDSDRALLHEVKNVIQQKLPNATVFLYGSVARGDRRPESDYDLLILTDESLKYDQKDTVQEVVYYFELEHNVVLSTVFFTKAHWFEHPQLPLHVSIERDGVQL